MDQSIPISAAAFFAALVFGLAAHFRTRGVAEMGERLARLEGRFDTYLNVQERGNARILHRPTHKDVDELLEKREQLKPLTDDEDKFLIIKLEEIIADKEQVPGFRAAAVQMLAARMARGE